MPDTYKWVHIINVVEHLVSDIEYEYLMRNMGNTYKLQKSVLSSENLSDKIR